MEQTMNQDATAGMMTGEVQKKNTGLIASMVVCAVLAVGGIAFGIYGMMQSSQKDSQISDLKVQIADKDGTITTLETEKIEINDDKNTITITEDVAPVVSGLYLINDISTKRRYYLGVTDLDQSKDSREVDTYLIDTTKLGTKDGVSKYDIKSVLDKITNEKVASLPDTLAAGTVNARPKSSCKSFRVRVGDVSENPKNINWVVNTKWDDLLPLTVYTECVVEDGNTISQSLGTSMYAINPQTGEYTKMVDNWY